MADCDGTLSLVKSKQASKAWRDNVGELAQSVLLKARASIDTMRGAPKLEEPYDEEKGLIRPGTPIPSTETNENPRHRRLAPLRHTVSAASSLRGVLSGSSKRTKHTSLLGNKTSRYSATEALIGPEQFVLDDADSNNDDSENRSSFNSVRILPSPTRSTHSRRSPLANTRGGDIEDDTEDTVLAPEDQDRPSSPIMIPRDDPPPALDLHLEHSDLLANCGFALPETRSGSQVDLSGPALSARPAQESFMKLYEQHLEDDHAARLAVPPLRDIAKRDTIKSSYSALMDERVPRRASNDHWKMRKASHNKPFRKSTYGAKPEEPEQTNVAEGREPTEYLPPECPDDGSLQRHETMLVDSIPQNFQDVLPTSSIPAHTVTPSVDSHALDGSSAHLYDQSNIATASIVPHLRSSSISDPISRPHQIDLSSSTASSASDSNGYPPKDIVDRQEGLTTKAAGHTNPSSGARSSTQTLKANPFNDVPDDESLDCPWADRYLARAREEAGSGEDSASEMLMTQDLFYPSDSEQAETSRIDDGSASTNVRGNPHSATWVNYRPTTNNNTAAHTAVNPTESLSTAGIGRLPSDPSDNTAGSDNDAPSMGSATGWEALRTERQERYKALFGSNNGPSTTNESSTEGKMASHGMWNTSGLNDLRSIAVTNKGHELERPSHDTSPTSSDDSGVFIPVCRVCGNPDDHLCPWPSNVSEPPSSHRTVKASRNETSSKEDDGQTPTARRPLWSKRPEPEREPSSPHHDSPKTWPWPLEPLHILTSNPLGKGASLNPFLARSTSAQEAGDSDAMDGSIGSKIRAGIAAAGKGLVDPFADSTDEKENTRLDVQAIVEGADP